MSRIAYVNGRYLPQADACVNVEDRGYQFGDAVYEVWLVAGGRLCDAEGHFTRLARSLGELSIPTPMSRKALEVVLRETLRRNRVKDGLLYLQISRGVARRDHPFPVPAPPPAVVVTARSLDPSAGEAKAERGVGVITTPESRWGRCDIKTVNLLPNVLAKQAAKAAGAYEAWFVDELGFVSEGSSTNAWIVDREGVLRTRDIQANILRGVTRAAVLKLAAETGLTLAEGPFAISDALEAKEAFITGASTQVTPVVSIDGRKVGTGEPGPVAQRLRQLYIAHARREAE
jgi:D-alanine transaminase